MRERVVEINLREENLPPGERIYATIFVSSPGGINFTKCFLFRNEVGRKFRKERNAKGSNVGG